MTIKLNSCDNAEQLLISIDPIKHPIAWANRVKSLINSGLTKQAAEDEVMLHPTIEMEIHYDVECGAFIVEAEAIESTEIYNPYTGAVCEVDGDDIEDEEA